MKTQTKALIASLIVVALGLSAVSGVTYSWWSDSENVDIEVKAGTLDVRTKVLSVDGQTTEGTNVYGITVGGPIVSITVNNYQPTGPENDLVINYEVSFYNTIDAKILIGYQSGNNNVSMSIQDSSSITPNVATDLDARGDGNSPSLTVTVTLIIEGMVPNEVYNVKVYNEIYQRATVWDGQASEEPVFAGGTYQIFNAAQLKGFADGVARSGPIVDATVELMNDIDLNKKEWTPIGGFSYSGTSFGGIFKGNGNKIMNLYVNGPDSPVADSAAGLFSFLHGDVNDLTIENAEIMMGLPKETAGGVGALAGSTYLSGTEVEISNVKVTGEVTIRSLKNVGAILGYATENVSISSCNVGGSSSIIEIGASPQLFDGTYCEGINVGSVVGFAAPYHTEKQVSVSDCIVSNVELYGYAYIGGIAGTILNGVVLSNNSVSEVQIEVLECQNHEKNIQDEIGHGAGPIVGRGGDSGDVQGSSESSVTISYPGTL